MRFLVDGNEVYASTGGRDWEKGRKTLVFVHGAGSSHLVWAQQSRSFAYGGYNVLALDLPGHNLSQGEPIVGIEAQAEWLSKVFAELSIEEATLVGHSQGGLIALVFAHQSPEKVNGIVFIATAAAIPVGDVLLNWAGDKQTRAKSAMTSWALGTKAHHFDNTVPGVSQAAIGMRTMDRNEHGALPSDLNACNDFEGGIEMAAALACPTQCIFAELDRMTPLKLCMQLADALPDNRVQVLKGAGHTLPTERPIEVNEIMRDFLHA